VKRKLAIFAALSVLALSCASMNLFGQKEAALKNDDVIDMVKTGLGPDLIIAKIKSSATKFDTSAGALKSLKEAGVPENVMLAMIQAGTPVITEDDTENTGEPTAALYFYRRKEFASRNLQPSVYIDGTEIARMDDGRFFIVKIEPGKHTITVDKGLSGAAIDAKAGKRYFFKTSIVAGMWKAHGEITFIQKEQGLLEIGTVKPLEDKWIKEKARVSTAMPATKQD
jgi:Protein of unknown function (DUF2846)